MKESDPAYLMLLDLPNMSTKCPNTIDYPIRIIKTLNSWADKTWNHKCNSIYPNRHPLSFGSPVSPIFSQIKRHMTHDEH